MVDAGAYRAEEHLRTLGPNVGVIHGFRVYNGLGNTYRLWRPVIGSIEALNP